MSDYQLVKLKSVLGIYKNKPYEDLLENTFLLEKSLDKLCREIEQAKRETDFVIVNLHSGGQFNRKVGSFTEYVVSKISSMGADAVVGHHPHIVQRCDVEPDFIVAYSLGNFCISPSSVYLIKEDLPEYSVMLHFYFSLQSGLELESIAFSILKIVESQDRKLTVIPVYDLYQSISGNEKEKLAKDCRRIYEMFMMKTAGNFEIEDEYIV